ncbi:MAG: adenosylcobinamide-GDP ribazoletransferase [Syntrophobacteraceae bacterium]
MDAPHTPKTGSATPLTIVALAFSFLTLIPIPSRWLASVTTSDLARSFAVFPFVGFTLGVILTVPAWLLADTGSSLLHATMLASLLCFLTRALHLDGLADVADGFGGGYTPERRLEIMKDSRTGAFGVAAIVFLVALKISALDVLISRHTWGLIAFGPLVGRFAMVVSAYGSHYARKEGGLGQSFIDYISGTHLLTASLCTAILSLLLAGAASLLPLAAVLCFVCLARFTSRHMIGGLTGDVLGAINEISETLAWTVLALLSHPR